MADAKPGPNFMSETAKADVERGDAPGDNGSTNASAADAVRVAATSSPVVIIGRSSCPFCLEAESLFRGQGVEPCTFWLDQGDGDSAWHDTCKKKYGQKTVPYVFVRGEFVGGCDEAMSLQQSGELARRLAGLSTAAAAPAAPATNSQLLSRQATPRPLFYFPDLVDSYTARVSAGIVAAIAITSIPLRNEVGMRWAVLGLLVDFSVRFVAGPGPSPIANLAKVIVALLRWRKEPNFVQGWPKQFATFVGTCFTAISVGLYFVDTYGTRVAGACVMATLAFCALLECLFDFCAGCFMFSIAVQLGLVPKSLYRVGVQSKPEMSYSWKYANERKKLPKPEIGTHSYAKEPTSIDFKWKLQDQEDHERFDWSLLRHARGSIMQVPTALFALAAVWKLASFDDYQLSVSSTVYEVLLGISFVVFVVCSALYLLRAAIWPRKVWKEWMCPVNSNFFSVFAIGVMLLAFLLVDLWGAGRTMGKVLWWMSAPTQLALALARVNSLVSSRMSIEAINPGWLMQPTGLFVAALVGPYLDPVHYTEASYFWFGFGLLLYIAFFVITLNNAITTHHSDERLRPLMWAWVAAPAIASVAWAALQAAEGVQRSDNTLPTIVGDDVFAKLLYFFALGMALSLALGFVQGFFGRARFSASADWTYAFPVAALTLAAITYEAAVPGDFTRGLTLIAIGTTSWVVAFLSLQTIWLLISGGVFKPEQKWGPMSIMRLTHEAFRAFIPKLLDALTAATAAPDNQRAVDTFLELWRQFELVHGAHSQHEDKVIFATMEQYIPGVAAARSAEHHAQHAEHDKWVSMVGELHGKGSNAPRRAEVLAQLARELPAFMDDMQAHLKQEEMTLQPVARKLIPAPLQGQMLRKIFCEVTSAEEWRTYLPWVVNNLPMLPQKVRFLRCLLWAVPERGEMIGRMVALGVDEVTWARIKEHLPEIIPRGASGWRRYY